MNPVSKVLYEMSVAFLSSEQNNQNFTNYDMMRKEPGWAVHQGLLIALGNHIATYMLSEVFTKLDKDEKDAQQRSFYHTKEIIDFLVDPLKGANKYAAFKQHNKKMEATTLRKAAQMVMQKEATALGKEKK